MSQSMHTGQMTDETKKLRTELDERGIPWESLSDRTEGGLGDEEYPKFTYVDTDYLRWTFSETSPGEMNIECLHPVTARQAILATFGKKAAVRSLK